MNLDAALSIATMSLRNIDFQLGVVSNNVANANTPDYAAQHGTQESLVAGFEGMGVRMGVTARSIDLALQQATFRQDTTLAELTTTRSRLSVIDAVHGTPGQGGDLASLTGRLRDAFATLLGDPGNGARHHGAREAARGLARGLNALSEAYTGQRQAAQTGIAGAVREMNAALRQIGHLSNRVIAAQSAHQPAAELENQRDGVVHGLGKLLGIRTFNQPNGDLLVSTSSGTLLPTRSETDAVTTTDATIGPEAVHPGAIPAITLNNVDITSRIDGGRLGAEIAMRDQTLPRFQAELDEFSFSLAVRFEAQGLRLFTGADGTVPAGGGTLVQASYVGFSATIRVSTAINANPELLRDGTHAVLGSPTGASDFAPNPAGGPVGFSMLVDRVLGFALGAEVRPGVAQPVPARSGLGPAGDLSAAFAPPATLLDHAAALVGAQSAESATVQAQLETGQVVQQTLMERLTMTSGVNMDAEMAHMIVLQNAYAASARIISTVQSLFLQLMQVR